MVTGLGLSVRTTDKSVRVDLPTANLSYTNKSGNWFVSPATRSEDGLAGAFEQKLTVSTKSGYAKFI